MNFGLRICISWVALCLLLACKQDSSTGGTQTKTSPAAQVTIPAFDRDSAYHYVETQVQFGPRNLGSEGHRNCRDWLVSKLKAFGAEVSQQHFSAELYTGEVFQGTNIIGNINPSHPKRIVLAAHWDTRHVADKDPDADKRDLPIPGADDGASGVAVLLEIARTLQAHPIDLGVDIVLFDAEDHGEGGGASETWCLGSQYWARNYGSMAPARYGILLDMVGSKGARFPQEAISVNFGKSILDKIWPLAQSMGYGHYFVNDRVNSITDDHLFVNQLSGLPMIDIINHTGNSFGSYWHTHDDDLSIIDRNTLRAVGQVVIALLYKESVGAI